jgi:hypothetical protein
MAVENYLECGSKRSLKEIYKEELAHGLGQNLIWTKHRVN